MPPTRVQFKTVLQVIGISLAAVEIAIIILITKG